MLLDSRKQVRITAMYVVGLTGGIGSGKSTVAGLFANLGVHVVDADQSARVVVRRGSPALAAIEQHFGPEIISGDGELDRRAMREKVFNNDAERRWLEALLHPLIFDYTLEKLNSADSEYAILESPLLLETTQKELANRILVIDVPEALQIERALLRDNTTKQQIQAIMAAQFSREQRLQMADDILYNDQSQQELETQVLALHQRYLSYANQS